MRHLHYRAALVLSFLAVAATAQAEPLRVVSVVAPDVNCVFDPKCAMVVTDSVADLPAAPGYSGKARLQSRTATAAGSGAPGAGTTLYEYRVDLMGATATANPTCVAALTLDVGPIASLPYLGNSQPMAEIFVIEKGGIGSVGVTSASRAGNAVTFQFSQYVVPTGDAPPPICPGKSSFFFGLASVRPPVAATAQIHMGTDGWHPIAARRAGP